MRKGKRYRSLYLPAWTIVAAVVILLGVIAISTYRNMARETGRMKEALLRAGVQSMVCLPLVSADKLVGAWGLDAFRQPRSWSEEDIGLLRTLGDIIAGALQRGRADLALVVFQGEIVMAGGRHTKIGDFAFHPDQRVVGFEEALDAGIEPADGEYAWCFIQNRIKHGFFLHHLCMPSRSLPSNRKKRDRKAEESR